MTKIFVFSDVVCPWCFLGKRRLERALDTVGLRAGSTIHWLPFELNPDMPEGGMKRAEYREAKFGPERSAELDERMRALGRDEGVAFAFDRMERTPNTRRAHMLTAYATDQGRGGAVVEALFRAYFEDALDIGDPAVLVAIAEAQGLDPEAARAVLGSEELHKQVVALERRAAEMGIGGVPFFILEGGQAISGAQPSAEWEKVLRELGSSVPAQRSA